MSHIIQIVIGYKCHNNFKFNDRCIIGGKVVHRYNMTVNVE